MRTGSVTARWLIEIVSANATSPVPIYISTFETDVRLLINGVNRNYIGAGTILGIPEIVYESGTVIQNQRLTLSFLSTEVVRAIKTYSPRLAPVEMRLAFIDNETNVIIDTPVVYAGHVDTVSIKESETDSFCEVVVASLNRTGTQTLALKKSDSAQRLRTQYSYSTPDEGRKYASVAGSVSVSWGQSSDTVFRMKSR